jgi:hypothetical protein
VRDTGAVSDNDEVDRPFGDTGRGRTRREAPMVGGEEGEGRPGCNAEHFGVV